MESPSAYTSARSDAFQTFNEEYKQDVLLAKSLNIKAKRSIGHLWSKIIN
jgi:hypothetical protein